MTAPAPAKSSGKGCIIAIAVVFGVIVLVGVIAVVALALLANKAEDEIDDVTSALSAPETVDPSNPDARDGDEVKNIGDGARISGFTATVESAEFKTGLDDLPPGDYLVVDVTLENRDATQQGFIPGTEWSLQTPQGTVVHPVTPPTSFGSTLAAGAKVPLTVVFPVGEADGDYFLLYRPDIIIGDRGVWPVST
jgi:flagellar basal body-associated protein FliL